MANNELAERVVAFKKEIKEISESYELPFLVESYYRVLEDDLRYEHKALLCFVKTLRLPKELEEKIETIFHLYFSGHDGTPVSGLAPCP